ncbi:hypothetical protein [Bradyrhizobium elkanii]|uniref:hypothetical protein n=1 Tax=Bradyrhizobium elkanii TaxID=29448 RepID=UPI001443EE0B|nr:hypothetical protein [Bradyrhizobium elkanii]MCS3689314.1 hypothetical protein [Bradyrhizobium elkanii]MCW2196665.1 hypothetical protein [Bradyrhizobium elkanii]
MEYFIVLLNDGLGFTSLAGLNFQTRQKRMIKTVAPNVLCVVERIDLLAASRAVAA